MKIEVMVGIYDLDVLMDVLAEAQGMGLPFVHVVEEADQHTMVYLYVRESHEDRLREFLMSSPYHKQKFNVMEGYS